jgi:hypothetical protein
MKAFISLLLSVVTINALSASGWPASQPLVKPAKPVLESQPKQPDGSYEPKWVAVAADKNGTIIHDIDANSITAESESDFTFAHRVRFSTTRVTDSGLEFNQHMSINYVSCSQYKTKIVRDVMLMDLHPVAMNVISNADKLSTPKVESVHGFMMAQICGPAKQNHQSGTNL